MSKKYVLVVNSYGFGLKYAVATEYNKRCARVAFNSRYNYNMILLVGGWMPGDQVAVSVSQKQQLSDWGVDWGKLRTPLDDDLNVVLPADTVEEILVAGCMLEELGYHKSDVVIDFVCMNYHSARVRECCKHLGVDVRAIHEVQSDLGGRSPMLYELLAWAALRTATDGEGLLLSLVRATRRKNDGFWRRGPRTDFWEK